MSVKLIEVETFQKNAHEASHSIFDGKVFPKDNAYETLVSMDWSKLCQGFYEQKTLAEMNLELDPKGCLGRTALAAALVEEYFPDTRLQYAEVNRDYFRDMLLWQWRALYNNLLLPGDDWIEEFLIYEEPHSVLIVDGKQFDPLFCVYASQTGGSIEALEHPSITSFPLWEAMVAARMTSEAWLIQDKKRKLEKLREAERVCPGTAIVKQNLIEPLLDMGTVDGYDEALRGVRDLCDNRPTVRSFLALEEVFGERHRHSRKDLYDDVLWEILSNYVKRMIQ